MTGFKQSGEYSQEPSTTGINPSRLFIERPVATTLLMLAILMVGILSYRFLPVSALPDVDYPTIVVTTFYPGAGPEVTSSSVTAPLERYFGQMPGLDQMQSQSSAGASVITLRFNLNLSLDIAEQEVQASINSAQNLLPTDLPAPPIYAKVNPADTAVITLALTSKTLPLTQVEDLADTRLAQKLSQLGGVGLVSVSGGKRPAVRVQANLMALAAYGLNIDDLRTTIGNLNVNSAKGSLDGVSQSWTINANDQIKNVGDYENSVIAYKNGAPVRLKDVASVVQDAENVKLGAWMNETPAIILNVQRQPGANVIQVVDRVKALLPDLQATLPDAVEVTVLTDRTTTIRASVADVKFELALSIGLVVLVIFLFLRNIPATIIPSLSVPLSLVGTLAVMYLLGFSLDNLSLMALTIATGFVVDDAIVMIENIARYIEIGEKPMAAALKGSKEIGFTIISLTISLIAVLIPLLFMGDVVGRLFHEFALTLSATIIISAVVSLTLVPMLCARLLKQHLTPAPSPFEGEGWGRGTAVHQSRSESGSDFPTSTRALPLEGGGGKTFFTRLHDRYATSLAYVLDRQFATLMVALATLILTVILYIVIPKGFFPVQDTGMIQAISEASPQVSYAEMARKQQALAQVILQDADVASLSSFIGVDGSNNTLNTGRFLINLKSLDDRHDRVGAISRRLSDEVAAVAGITLQMQPVQDLTVDTSVTGAQYQFTLENTDDTQFALWMPKLLARLAALPELRDVGSDLQKNGLALNLVIDRATAGRYGITPATVDNALYDAFGQRIVSTIFTQSNQYRVILEADPNLQKDLSALDQIYLPSSLSTTGQVRLSSIVSVEKGIAPLMIEHLGQFPATTVSFNLAPGASLGKAVKAIGQAEKDIGLPNSFQTRFQGATAAFQNSLSNEIFLLLAAIVTVYIVLGVLYESFIHPITILSTLPSAGIGALLSLMIAGAGLDVIGIIGIVLLIGIVKKNAIMMIDFALEAERQGGKEPREAIYQACLLRLRPILMTTFAAMLGALPLMLASGTGSELRRPLGIAIVGGLAVSQLLTLYTTPVIYLYFDRLGRRFAPKRTEDDQDDPHALDDWDGVP